MIHKNYPSGSPDEEIFVVISDFSKRIVDSNFNINTVLQLSPAIQLGQSEIQKRILERSAKETSKIQKLAICIAIISLLFSFIAIYLTYLNIRSDQVWQTNQINLLKEIEKKTRTR